jgi:two-component system KDP operon response regulator KdpE
VHILVVNSDPEVDRQLKVLLERQGHDVLVSPGIAEALALLGARRVDLLVVECQQLELNGTALFRQLARWPQPPVILPTISHPAGDHSPRALPAEVERVQDAMLQVQRLLAQPQGEVLRVGDLTIDTIRKRVFVHGQSVLLPPIQFRLLVYLAQNTGRVVGARELLKAVWGYEGDETEARELVKVHVRQIRRRLGLDGQGADYVQSVRGFGYVVTPPTQP